jgi:hypothetical protein
MHSSHVQQEGESGIIELKVFSNECPDVADDDPRAVKLMIDYLYLRDYDPATADEYKSLHTVEAGVETMFAEPNVDSMTARSSEHADAIPADQNPNLREFWDSWAKETIELDPESSLGPGDPNTSFLEMHAKMFVIASKYDITPLKDAAFKKLKYQTKLDWRGPDLIAAMTIVFSQTPESSTKLRTIFKNVIVKHARTLVKVSGFQEAVADIEGLAYDLFLRQTKSIG